MPPREGCRLPSRIGAPPVTSWLAPNVGDLPPWLHGHYPASPLLRSSPPLPGASVVSASRVRRLCLFPWHRRLGSQVPYESPNESHASYTPDTAWSVRRRLPCWSRSSGETPVLVSSGSVSMLHQRFTCVRLSHPYMTRSSPRLLTMTFTTAAFDRSSSWQFGASSCEAAPKGPPSSLLQHGAFAPS